MKRQTPKQSGFSLFEVLIAMAVTVFGLLGLVAMQAAGLMSNQSAYHKSQATVLAYDITDRMRANMGSINNYLTSYMTLAQAETAGAVAACETTDGCSSAELAQNDLYEWGAALESAAPGATGTITLDAGIYTVSVNWDDNRDGAVDASDPGFQVSFQP